MMHEPIFAPRITPIAPVMLIAWLMPIATAMLVTAVLLWVMEVKTRPARIPNKWCRLISPSRAENQGDLHQMIQG